MIESLFYVKEALGKGGKPIKIYKFRTMKCSPHALEEVLQQNLNQYSHPIEEAREFVMGGRFLRKYWIDELPQIYNLIRGNMRMVGIRPMQKEYWERYPKEIRDEALKTRPGLFGVQYYHTGEGDFDVCVSTLRRYLKEREENPLLTDLKYFFRIAFNIIFKGTKST